MHLWPSRQQWKRWNLPSKLTAVGAYIGILAFVITIAIYVFSPAPATREGQGKDLVEHEETQAAIRELIELEQRKRADVRGLELPAGFDPAQLGARYPLGWAFFYGYGGRVVASKQSFETVEVIAWPNMRIDTQGRALFTGEYYVHKTTRNTFINHGLIVIDRIGRAPALQIDDTCFWYELINVADGRALGLVGFNRSERTENGARVCH